jgi:hypothetical membrane protein
VNTFHRSIALLAMAVPFCSLLVYLGMASTRPDVAHATKAISELGSVDTPNGWIWNICGYMIPGTIVASLGWGLGSHFCNTKGARLGSSRIRSSHRVF